MGDINPAQSLNVSVKRLREILEQRHVAWFPLKIQLPTIKELQSHTPLNELETPWSSSLQGFRIAKFNDKELRFLNRYQDKVLWSRELDSPLKVKIYESFLMSIQLALNTVLSMTETNLEHIYKYDLDTCGQLLRMTFLEPGQSRLAPHLIWPSNEECIELTKSVLGQAPWKYKDFLSDITLSETSDGLYFVVRGERGEIEKTYTSMDANQVYLFIFEWITGKEIYNDVSKLSAQFSQYS